MLDGVIKGPGLTLAPFARVVADPEAAAGRYDQGQVADQTGIDQTMMGWDAGPRFQLREQDRRRPARNPAQRDLGQGRQGARAAAGDLRLLLTVLPQKQGTPVGVGHHADSVPVGPVGARLDIGAEQIGFGQQTVQLRADLTGRSLDRRQPGQGLARLELDLRQAGKQIEARLLLIQPLAPRHQVQRQGEPVAGGRRVESGRAEAGCQMGLEPLGLGLNGGLCAAQVSDHVRGQPLPSPAVRKAEL